MTRRLQALYAELVAPWLKGRRIAMWSGPRNLSTAMMRSFGNRADCAAVLDEPFYAAYLARAACDHPMRAEVLAAQPQDWRAVARACATAAVAARTHPLPEAHDPPHAAGLRARLDGRGSTTPS